MLQSIPELKKYPLAKDLHHHADFRWRDFPWQYLQPGQSFLVPWPKTEITCSEKRRLQNRIAARLYEQNHNRLNRERAHPRRFIQRTTPDGIRIWRIK
jgi:hypothetical protein